MGYIRGMEDRRAWEDSLASAWPGKTALHRKTAWLHVTVQRNL